MSMASPAALVIRMDPSGLPHASVREATIS